MVAKKVYKCDMKECQKLFSSKFSLKRHYLIHLKVKPHKCSHANCTKAFSLPQYLEEHEYTHTRQKPFICNIGQCKETFRQRGKLSIHKKIMHGADAPDLGLVNMGLHFDDLMSDDEEEKYIDSRQRNIQLIRA